MATGSQAARNGETLMRCQPRPIGIDPWPDSHRLCELCQHALTVGQNLFSSVVYSVLNQRTMMCILSIDIMHQQAPHGDMIPHLYPGKVGWQHVLRLYNHNRTDYLQNMGITIIYRPEPHTTRCDYAHILTELGRKAEASRMHQAMFHFTLETIMNESRLFAGPGTTSVERKGEPLMVNYLVQTHLGKNRTLNIQPGFTRIYTWHHNHQSLEQVDRVTSFYSDDDDTVDERVVYQPTNPYVDRTTQELEELTLETPKRRLKAKGRRGTH